MIIVSRLCSGSWSPHTLTGPTFCPGHTTKFVTVSTPTGIHINYFRYISLQSFFTMEQGVWTIIYISSLSLNEPHRQIQYLPFTIKITRFFFSFSLHSHFVLMGEDENFLHQIKSTVQLLPGPGLEAVRQLRDAHVNQRVLRCHSDPDTGTACQQV